MSSQVAAVQNIAKPSRLGIGAISTIAEISSSQLGYLEDFNIVRVVRRLGGEIETKDFWGTAHDGSLEVRSPNSFTISVPFHTSIERDKFTVAHELGHLLLHYILASDGAVREQPFYAKRYGGGLEEKRSQLVCGLISDAKGRLLQVNWLKSGQPVCCRSNIWSFAAGSRSARSCFGAIW